MYFPQEINRLICTARNPRKARAQKLRSFARVVQNAFKADTLGGSDDRYAPIAYEYRRNARLRTPKCKVLPSLARASPPGWCRVIAMQQYRPRKVLHVHKGAKVRYNNAMEPKFSRSEEFSATYKFHKLAH